MITMSAGFVVVSTMMSMMAMTMAAPQPVEEINLLMPQVKPKVHDTYLCTAMKVEDDHRYITGFVPVDNSHVAHHILLYGCDEPGGAPGEVWDCGEMSSHTAAFKSGSVCKTDQNIIYAWAMEAPRLNLPQDVSFDVGQQTPIKYLVVQVHYNNVSKFLPPQNGVDSSGVKLITRTTPTPKQAAVFLFATGGYIPAHSIEYFEAACEVDDDVEMVPFAFRTHAHSLGRVISGYRIRDGQWTEIGRRDPRQPEMFYNATTPGLKIEQGDIIAARCTMENTLDHEVSIGSTKEDEMCNFYMMYYVEKPPVGDTNLCVSPGPPYWYWRDYDDLAKLHLEGVPQTASTIPGQEKPLIRNATYEDESKETVAGIPGRFEDIDAEDLINTALSEMSPDELFFMLQQLGVEEEEEEREKMLLQKQGLRQREAYYDGARAPYNIPLQ